MEKKILQVEREQPPAEPRAAGKRSVCEEQNGPASAHAQRLVQGLLDQPGWNEETAWS